jgi:predicted GNAT superfamily acetyltransferase
MTIRLYTPADLPALFSINEASVPGVGKETQASLEKWIDLSQCFVAVDEAGKPQGFITLLPPGTTEYDSANLRWLENWREDFIYVDRIAIAASARGRGIGEALYRAAFAEYAGKTAHITCEVNRLPPNPGSMRFHKRLGFEEIGEQTYVPGEKAVVFLARALKQK